MDIRRVRVLKSGSATKGPVTYWISRDQRVRDNWALLHAQEIALEKRVPLVVLFCLVPHFLEASERHYGFMISGLHLLQEKLKLLNISFHIVTGEPDWKWEQLPDILVELFFLESEKRSTWHHKDR
jgi:deoxyribodipyrimidine photo-lyase